MDSKQPGAPEPTPSQSPDQAAGQTRAAEDRLPPNSFEVQEYETAVDSEGRSLDSSCTYRLTGRMPPIRHLVHFQLGDSR